MKRTKLALLSMIVVTTVFCLSMLFHIQLPAGSSQETATSAVDVTRSGTETASQDDLSGGIQSFALEESEDSTSDLSQDADGTQANQEEQNSQDNSLTEETDASGEASDETQSTVTPATADALAETPEDSTTEAAEAGDSAATYLEDELYASMGDSESIQAAKKAVQEEQPEAQYANIGISIAKDYVNIRKEPSTDGEVLGKLYRNSACEIISTEGDWYNVESGSVTGYVKAEYIQTGLSDDELIQNYATLKMSVGVDGLNVRKEKSTESDKLTVIYMNEKYPVEDVDGDWLLINIDDENISGYVKAEFAELIVEFKYAVSKEEEQKLLQLQAEAKAKKETEVIYNNGYSYTSEDLKLLACLVHSEAGTQSYEGKLAVANVVLNRMKSSKYPDTIKAVIYQSGQFSVARSGSLEKQLNNYSNYSSNSQKMSIKAAKDALEGANNIGSRMYFRAYSTAVKNGYTSYSTAVKLGDHLFW